MGKSFILFKNTWAENIGNAFIDLGSILLLQKAMENKANIHIVSSYPIKLFADGPNAIRKAKIDNLISKGLTPLSKKLLGRHFESVSRQYLKQTQWEVSKTVRNAFSLVNAVKSDHFVASGKLLTIAFLTSFSRVFDELKEKGTKIIFLGAGGSYSSGEVSEVRRLLKEVRPYMLISRDEIAFENYRDLAEYSYNGIDCAFFVNELPMLQEIEVELAKYVTLCFDRIPEPKIGFNPELLIIRTSHFSNENPKERFYKQNMLVSDSPIDYLTLYKHTEETYSDRNHACVATLSFGKPARLYLKLASSPLFDKIGAGTVTCNLTYPDTDRIQIEKERQIRFLSEVLG